MVELVRFEFYKVFQQRFLWVMLILVFCVGLVISFQRMGLSNAERINKGFEGELTSEMVQRAESGIASFKKSSDITLADLKQNGTYATVLSAEENDRNQAQRVASLRKKATNATSSYESYQYGLQADLMESIDYRPVGNYQTFEQLITFLGTGGYALLAVILILGTAVSISNEYQTGVVSYLYSSSYGRKQLLTAKLIVSVALITGIILIYNLVQLLCFFRGYPGWNIAIQFVYNDSPYPLSMSELYGIAILYQWLIAISLVIVVLFLSMLIKQTVVAIFLSGLIIGGPFLVESLVFNSMTPTSVRTLLQFTQGQSLSVYVLFREYVTVNVFGYPVLLPIAVLVVTLITTLILIKLMYRVIGRRMA
nr:ABC transporter permease subunit [Exiguobacterium sp. KRL4]